MQVSSERYDRAGFVRLKQILGPDGLLPISKSTWWEGVRTGKYPQPVKLSSRITAWRWSDIEALIERLQQGGA